ncbi:MAG TPA: hypothetical protein VGL56_09255 [Fimbriimonadaceae bacterium]|jgi:hypothetical protein
MQVTATATLPTLPFSRQLDVLRKWIVFAQWALLITALPFGMLLFVRRGAEMVAQYHAKDQDIPTQYWSLMIWPAAFLGGIIAIVMGRVILAYIAQIRLKRWYHPAFMVRDWIVASAAMSLIYEGLIFAAKTAHIPHFGEQAGTLQLEFQYRFPLQLVAGIAGVMLVTRIGNIVSPGTILPLRSNRMGPPVLYGILIVASNQLVGSLLSWVAKQQLDDRWVVISGTCFIFSVLFYVFISILTLGVSATIPKAGLPVESYLAMVGPPQVGKTVFMYRAYKTLMNFTLGHMDLTGTPASTRFMKQMDEEMEDRRRWPQASVELATIPFLLREGIIKTVDFNWLDLPGGVFTRDESEVEDLLRPFEEQLSKANTLVLMFSAWDLKGLKSLDGYAYYAIYRRQVVKFYEGVQESGRPSDQLSIAIIVAQAARVDMQTRFRLRPMMKPLVEHCEFIASQAGAGKPDVRVFISSAVVNAKNDDRGEPVLPAKPEPIISDNCAEPILWLASRVLRQNAAVLEHATSFFVSGCSRIQNLVVSLEDASR